MNDMGKEKAARMFANRVKFRNTLGHSPYVVGN